MQKVGFIGLGNLGGPMASNVQKHSGMPMVVHDVREEATRVFLENGATLASSPADVAAESDIVLTSLPGPKEIEEAATGRHGLLNGIGRGDVFIDLSTSRPDLIRRLEPMFRAKGAHVLDAPVLSTKTDAVDRNVIVMVGGEREIFDQVRPIFDAFANKVIYAGGLGTGYVCKLVHNMMIFGVRQVVAEGLTLGLKAGLDLETLMDAGSPGLLATMSDRLRQTVFRGQFDPPNFALALARKDIGLAMELAQEVDVPTPVAQLIEGVIQEGVNRGWGGLDSSVAFLLQEEAAGVEVRSA